MVMPLLLSAAAVTSVAACHISDESNSKHFYPRQDCSSYACCEKEGPTLIDVDVVIVGGD